MSAKSKTVPVPNKDVPLNLKGYLSFFAVLIIVLLLSGLALSQKADDSLDKETHAIRDIEMRLNGPPVYSLDKGHPVGMIHLNGEKYIIYTTNEDDRSR